MQEREQITLTEAEYRAIAKSKLKEGHTYQFVRRDELDIGEGQGRRRKRVKEKMQVVRFYTHFVAFRHDNGQIECLTYQKLYVVMKGEE